MLRIRLDLWAPHFYPDGSKYWLHAETAWSKQLNLKSAGHRSKGHMESMSINMQLYTAWRFRHQKRRFKEDELWALANVASERCLKASMTSTHQADLSKNIGKLLSRRLGKQHETTIRFRNWFPVTFIGIPHFSLTFWVVIGLVDGKRKHGFCHGR